MKLDTFAGILAGLLVVCTMVVGGLVVYAFVILINLGDLLRVTL